MKTQLVSLVLTVGVMLAPTFAAPLPVADEKPINAMCPIGKEPIVASAGTIEYEGKTIGLCCPGCGNAFLAWEQTRRDAFVALAMRGEEPGRTHGDSTEESTKADTASQSFPYPLDMCIISGEKLGSMGKPVILNHEGRELRLCCGGCIERFRAEPAKFVKSLDERIVTSELMHYEVDTCIVAGGRLGSMGAPVNFVYRNRLVRFCCAACIPTFESDPAKFLAALDRQIIERQSAAYPLATCVVADSRLGSMGDPVDHVYGNRLVRFCCASCIPGFEKEPGTFMAKIDAAYADAQRSSYPIGTCVVAGGTLGSMGDPVELVAGTRLVRFCCAACIPEFKANPAKYLALLRKD